jgi:hypothetical protein
VQTHLDVVPTVHDIVEQQKHREEQGGGLDAIIKSIRIKEQSGKFCILLQKLVLQLPPTAIELAIK